MDIYSTGDLARRVGLSVPAVHRAVARFGIVASSTPGGHLRFGEPALAALVEAVGRTPIVEGFSRQELFVFRALSHAPLGLRSRRAVARAAGVSPTAAGDALERLVEAGIVGHRQGTFAEGVATEGELWRLNYASAMWLHMAPVVAMVVLPGRTEMRRARAVTVPRRLHHLFWNAEPAMLDVGENASYIATRLLLGDDAQGLAWAAANLPPAALESAARNRAATPEIKATARNLAAAVA